MSNVQLNVNEYIPTQREEIKLEINRILDDFMQPLVDSTIIAEIMAIGFAAAVPKSFLDGVKFIKTAPNKGKVVNIWGTIKNPLARYFNYGTSTHWIEPKEEGGVLAFPATGGRNASAIFFQGESAEGDMMFSKGHYVSGVPRTEVMERGFQIGKKRLAVEAGNIIQRELRYVQ